MRNNGAVFFSGEVRYGRLTFGPGGHYSICAGVRDNPMFSYDPKTNSVTFYNCTAGQAVFDLDGSSGFYCQ